MLLPPSDPVALLYLCVNNLREFYYFQYFLCELQVALIGKESVLV